MLDTGSHQDRLFLVTELSRAQPGLADRGRPAVAADVVRIGAELAAALAHVHGSWVGAPRHQTGEHPARRAGRPRLTDFGIALRADQSRLTDGRDIIGTPAYLAPEQVRGSAIGPAADIYALGLVLLECLTGRIEYPGTGRLAAALARLERRPRIPAELPTRLGRCCG